jgi:hypothetical protein
VSLSIDSKEEWAAFLQKKHCVYEVLPKQSDDITQLNLLCYPSHIRANKNGRILKVENDSSKIISGIETQETSTKLIPPPPAI